MDVIKARKIKITLSIKTTVVSIFIISVLLTATVAISLQYVFGHRMAVESATQLFNSTTEHTASNLTNLNQQIENTLKILSKSGNIEAVFTDAELRFSLAEIMNFNGNFYAIYLGTDSGELYEIVNLDSSPVVRKQLGAIVSDRWVLIEIVNTPTGKRKLTHFYNSELEKRLTKSESSDFDPRNRLWFTNANEQNIVKTKPYLFQNLQAPGQTYSLKLPNKNSVLAIDIALASLSEYLMAENQKLPDAHQVEMYLFQQQGQLIASNQQQKRAATAIPKAKPLVLNVEQQAVIDSLQELTVSNELDWAPIDFAVAGKPAGYSVDTLTLISDMLGVNVNFINGFSWQELIDLFNEKKLHVISSAYDNAENRELGLLTESFLTTPFAMITQAGQAEITTLKQLHGKSLVISADWAITEQIKTQHPEIDLVEVPNTAAVLQAVKSGLYYAGIDNQFILQHTAKQLFIDELKYHVNLSQASPKLQAKLHFLLPKSKPILVDIFNQALENISDAQRQALANKWLFTGQKLSEFENLGIVPYQELVTYAQRSELLDQLHPVTIENQTKYLYISKLSGHDDYFSLLIPEETLFANVNDKLHISILVTFGLLLVLLPLCWLFAKPIVNPINALVIKSLKIKQRKFDEAAAVDSNIIEIQALATTMDEMATSIQAYQQNQKDLMDAFIELIGQAIDDKSPYTAGHCERVPELGMLLAMAASNINDGPLKDFAFKDEDEVREFKVAAWLHDCGKITTPEHIVDKGTKLETSYNRIHEIRMRFEVLWRDAELVYWQALNEGAVPAQTLLMQKTQQQQQLQQDFAFIATANIGGEFIDQKHVDKLKKLQQVTWTRYFDDRLGLSPIEELRLSPEPETLPVVEQLIADKPQHIIPHDKAIKYDERLGIKIEVPAVRANLGELHNLTVARGTLTAEDRFKINEHIISTIRMLDKLPFPPELAKVPKYASTHHETLIGTGYPRKLTAEQLSIPERVLVLADIFEALTAADRPYKKAKPLSVAIDILHKMVLNQHVDADVFRLFLSSGIYLQYSDKYLDAAQKDNVDIDYYLNYVDDKKMAKAS
ncbi:MAG: HD domain-containing phosphohydrolase [Cognaticolwellia sp.]